MIKIGIISEGAEDQGVIANILNAVAKEVGLDMAEFEVKPIRPERGKSETHLNNPNNISIGTFQGVQNACISKEDFENFFIDEDSKFIVVHIDTAEIDRQNFEFARPTKENNPNYATELRAMAIVQIERWLAGEFTEQVLYAIAIEEIEAWCLTIFEKKDSIYTNNLKNKLAQYLQTNNLTYKKLKLDPTRDKAVYFATFTRKYDFHKMKKLREYAQYNQSLSDFIKSVIKAITP